MANVRGALTIKLDGSGRQMSSRLNGLLYILTTAMQGLIIV